MTQQSELNLQGIDFEEGYIAVIDKPLEWTSSDVVRKIKFALRRAGYPKIKVGHAGTLDPLATGILLVCIGKATKMADALQAEEKEYVADLMLGATTPSFDLEHPIDKTYPFEHITREAVEEVLRLAHRRAAANPARLFGQEDRRRHGPTSWPARARRWNVRKALINIYEMELMEYDLPRIRIRVRCSKGTYIRSLAGRDRPGARQRCAPHLAAAAPAAEVLRLDAALRIELFSRKTAKSLKQNRLIFRIDNN